MKVSRISFFVICAFLYFTVSNAYTQALNYTFTALAGTYTANPSPDAVIACCNMDAFASAPITLPFSFKFGCVTYTDVVITENGWFTFDPNCWDFHNVNDLSNQVGSAPGIDRPIVAPLWDDLAGDFAGGNINYQTLGSFPNRIFVIEWKQMLWGWNAVTWAISFQCRLYETINRIEFVYLRNGSSTANLSSTPPPSASIGLAGLTIGNYYSLNGTGGAPTAVTSPEFDMLNSKPATNQVYRWDPVCPLPISLASFSGKKENGRNKIEWVTASEENNEYFTVEKSTDAYTFTELTRINGAGNSNVILHYHTFDPIPSEELVYYRLKQTDYNGKFTYSDIISINGNGQPTTFSFYPNPTKNELIIEGVDNPTNFKITDLTGKVLLEDLFHADQPVINISSLTPGVYYLYLGENSFHKIVVED